MANVEEHYATLLAEVYSWMAGGFEAGVERNAAFFERHGIVPRGNGVALDLGAGCGFQSIPLARAGFRVTAIDLDGSLLEELAGNVGELPVRIVRDDLLSFRCYVDGPAELIVCMTDTLAHLQSREAVSALLCDVFTVLDAGGRFIATFRDLSVELADLARFIPLRSDDRRILTCFLEYEPEYVKVHDLLHLNVDGCWQFRASFYRKLRLGADQVVDQLRAAGFAAVERFQNGGAIELIATK